MATLSDVDIERRINDGSLVLDPFEPQCLNGGGYDLRSNDEVRLETRGHRLVATLEMVKLSEDLIGTMYVRSSLARAGIIASLAVVDPGFRGQLTILLFNSAREDFHMSKGERFLQIIFHQLSSKTHRPYSGRYQDSQGIVERR